MIMTVMIQQVLQFPLCQCKASKPTSSNLFYQYLSKSKKRKDKRILKLLKIMSSLVLLIQQERVSQCITSIKRTRITSFWHQIFAKHSTSISSQSAMAMDRMVDRLVCWSKWILQIYFKSLFKFLKSNKRRFNMNLIQKSKMRMVIHPKQLRKKSYKIRCITLSLEISISWSRIRSSMCSYRVQRLLLVSSLAINSLRQMLAIVASYWYLLMMARNQAHPLKMAFPKSLQSK
jgi:hypothetical protein